jgi:hypothetical protein
VVPRSDDEGEFGEGRREPMLWVEFYAEFVVAAADVLDEGVSSADHADRAEPFEATHRPESALEPTMIRLDRIIPVLLHDVAHGRQQLIEYPRVGRCWSVLTSLGREPCSRAWAKNRRVAARSRLADTNTSMTCPSWSIAR